MNDKRRATIYNNYNNIIIIITFAKLILTKHQIAIASNFESFNFRLLSAIIKLSKTESKTYKRILNSKSNHFSLSSDLDSNLIINSFVRDIRKRLKCINILSDQSTFKSRSFISSTIFISPSFILLTVFISSLFISSNQSIFKLRSFTFFILINIIRK